MFTRNLTCVAALVLALCATANAELVTNGGFELPSGGTGGLAPGSTFTGWTVGASDGGAQVLPAGLAPTQVVQVGWSYGGAVGSIYQDLTTEVGKTYTVSFDYIGRSDQGDTLNLGKVTLGGVSADVSATGTAWLSSSFDVVATGATTRLTLESLEGGTLPRIVFDNVSVTAVPEPGALTLLVAGLLGLLCYAWRRRK